MTADYEAIADAYLSCVAGMYPPNLGLALGECLNWISNTEDYKPGVVYVLSEGGVEELADALS